MPPARVRLGPSDVMGLIVASGPSLAIYQRVDDGLFGRQRFFFGIFRGWPEPTLTGWIERGAGLAAASLVLLGGWTLALPVSALRAGRRGWRRLGRGPGLVACLAATAGMTAWAGVAGSMIWIRTEVEHRPIPPAYWSASPVFDGLLACAGVAVAAAWVVQAATGRWRPRADARDRIGRALGLMWLAVGAIFAAKRWIP